MQRSKKNHPSSREYSDFYLPLLDSSLAHRPPSAIMTSCAGIAAPPGRVLSIPSYPTARKSKYQPALSNSRVFTPVRFQHIRRTDRKNHGAPCRRRLLLLYLASYLAPHRTCYPIDHISQPQYLPAKALLSISSN